MSTCYWFRKHMGSALRLLEPVHHLTADEISELYQSDYVVGPKADGERALLVGDCDTPDVLLVKTSGSVTQIAGACTDALRGFILDVEIVPAKTGGSQLFLAFDVLALHPFFDLSSHNLKAEEDVPLKVTIAYQERREILTAIVDATSMAGLLVKPIADVSAASDLWKKAQRLPYPVDGLVFTPCCSGPVCYKWKPPEKLTVDVALGNELERRNDRSLFCASLLDDPEHSHHGFLVDSSISAPLCHSHFKFDANGVHRSFLKPTAAHELPAWAIEESDIWVTESQDLEAIKEEHRQESLNSCSGKHCPCIELFPSGRKLVHCSLCEVLCVANAYEEGCQCLECDTSFLPGVGRHIDFSTERTSSSSIFWDPSSLIWIPHKERDWASFRIIEASFNVATGKLHFERLRPDKAAANTFNVANTVFRAKANPIVLDDLLPNLKRSVEAPQLSYRGEATTKNSFSSLQRMHFSIKKWLYHAYGGARIVEACAGRLKDLKNWEDAGCLHVLALERDDRLIKEGHHRLKESSTIHSPQVELIKADLSEALNQEVGPEFKQKSSAVFCNFGLHYFWESPQDTHRFLTNLVQFLSEGGFFVATVMHEHVFASSSCVRILNANGGTEFEATKCDDQRADVFVASIGRVHKETLIKEADAKLRFSEVGLEHVVTYPFSDLHQLYPSIGVSLSQSEKDMSSLYTAYVFMKRPNISTAEDLHASLFSFPEEVEDGVLLYLNTADLVTKIRGLSRAARRRVDTLRLPDKKRWFAHCLSEIGFSALKSAEWPSASVGLFLRMGGTVLHDCSQNGDSYLRDFSDPGLDFLCGPFEDFNDPDLDFIDPDLDFRDY